mgnify:CR=1 FL=1
MNAYKKTEEYKKELISQINKISSDFNDTTVEFYIDSSDESLLSDLQSHTGADIKISTVPFIGGCKAIISDKNMLVDNSFKTKLAEEQEKNGDDGVEERETIRVVQEEGTDDGGDGDHVDCPEERLHGFLDDRKGAAVRFQGSQFA